jgi:hypothetical protein
MKFFLTDWIELNQISHPKESRRLLFRVKKFNRSSSKDLPASGTLDRIDACLFLSNGDRTRRNGEPWCFETGCDEGIWKFSHIREPGHKANHVDEVGFAAMQPDDFFRSEMKIFSNLL